MKSERRGFTPCIHLSPGWRDAEFWHRWHPGTSTDFFIFPYVLFVRCQVYPTRPCRYYELVLSSSCQLESMKLSLLLRLFSMQWWRLCLNLFCVFWTPLQAILHIFGLSVAFFLGGDFQIYGRYMFQIYVPDHFGNYADTMEPSQVFVMMWCTF